MFFQMDSTGDKGNGIKSINDACNDLHVPVPVGIVEQSQSGYCFEFHTSMHGTPVVYVNKASKGSRIGRNVPSIEIGPPTQWQRGESSLASKDAKDALATVSSNRALFSALFTAWTA